MQWWDSNMVLTYSSLETALKHDVVVEYVPMDEDCLYNFYYKDGYFYKEKLVFGNTLTLVKRKKLDSLFTKNITKNDVLEDVMAYVKIYYNIDELISRIREFVENSKVDTGKNSLVNNTIRFYQDINGYLSYCLEVEKFRSSEPDGNLYQFQLDKVSKYGLPRTVEHKLASENNLDMVLFNVCEYLRTHVLDGWLSYERNIIIKGD